MIYQIGPYPPPIGGISKHIQRLQAYLLARDYKSVVIDTTGVLKEVVGVRCSSKWYLLRLLLGKDQILHFHHDSPKLVVLMLLLSIRNNVLFSWHGSQFIAGGKDLFTQWLYRVVFARLKAFVVLNDYCYTYATQRMGLRNVHLIPSYIPPAQPSLSDEQKLCPYLGKYDFLLASYSYELAFNEGVDLYGVDLLVELVRELSRTRNVGMLLLLPGDINVEYLAELTQRIETYGIGDRFVFIREPLEEGASLWRISDLMIRSTNTDGNSLAVYEALEAGTPVVASDCVSRPPGTILFRTRDFADLLRVVSETLDALHEHKGRGRGPAAPSNAQQIENLYLAFSKAREQTQ